MRALRGRCGWKERLFSGNSACPCLPDTAAGAGGPGNPRCGSGRPGRGAGMLGSFLRGLPLIPISLSITASEHASTHAHARTELPSATDAEPRRPWYRAGSSADAAGRWRVCRRRDYRAEGRRVRGASADAPDLNWGMVAFGLRGGGLIR